MPVTKKQISAIWKLAWIVAWILSLEQLHSVIQGLIQESHFPIALLPYSNNLAESKTTNSVFQQCWERCIKAAIKIPLGIGENK